jgi:hypothetical protein
MEKNKMKTSIPSGFEPITFRVQIERSTPLGHQASHIRSLNWID